MRMRLRNAVIIYIINTQKLTIILGVSITVLFITDQVQQNIGTPLQTIIACILYIKRKSLRKILARMQNAVRVSGDRSVGPR